MSGQIIDASIIAAPRQRNTDAEKADLKVGRIPEAWAAKPKKLAQKDRDARWTLKRAKARPAKADGTKARVEIAVPMFGDMSHVSIDRKHGFVRRFTVTSAAAHDGAQLANVLDPANTAGDVWADTAYRSKTNEAHLAKHGRRSKIHFRRQPGHDLTPSQRKANRARSKVRSAVETVFAGQKHRFGLFVRTIGLARARTKIGLANLAYNLNRFLLPMRPGQPERRTHDYRRQGNTDLFAALDIQAGTVIGRCTRQHRSVEFRTFLDQIEAAVPDDLDVHLVLDNAATHKTKLIHDWRVKRPRWHLHFTPTSASWLNLVEGWFALLPRRRLQRAAFQRTTDL